MTPLHAARVHLSLAALLGLTACGSLLDASPDGLQLGPSSRFCAEPTGGRAGASPAGAAGAGGAMAGKGGAAGSIAGGNGGLGGNAGSAGSGGNAGSAGSGGNGGLGGNSGEAGNAGFGGQGGNAGASGGGNAGFGGNAGDAGAAGSGGNAGEAGFGGNAGAAGGGGNAGSGAGGSAGSPVGSPYDTITSRDFSPFELTTLGVIEGDLSIMQPHLGNSSFWMFSRNASQQVQRIECSVEEDTCSPPWQAIAGSAVTSTPSGASDGFPHVLAQKAGGVTHFRRDLKKAWIETMLNGSAVASAPVLVEAKGVLWAFVRGIDGTLLWAPVVGDKPADWTSLGGKITSAPAAVRDEQGNIDVFARWEDNTLAHLRFEGGAWGTWDHTSWGGDLADTPAVASWGSSSPYPRLDVFIRTPSNELQYRARREDGKSDDADWKTLTLPASTTMAGAPAAVATGIGDLRVFFHDGPGQVYMASLIKDAE